MQEAGSVDRQLSHSNDIIDKAYYRPAIAKDKGFFRYFCKSI
jgi:hypothetical protein